MLLVGVYSACSSARIFTARIPREPSQPFGRPNTSLPAQPHAGHRPSALYGVIHDMASIPKKVFIGIEIFGASKGVRKRMRNG